MYKNFSKLFDFLRFAIIKFSFCVLVDYNPRKGSVFLLTFSEALNDFCDL